MQRPQGDIGAHTNVPGSHAGVPHGQPMGQYNAWATGRAGVTLRGATWEMGRGLASVIDRPYRAIVHGPRRRKSQYPLGVSQVGSLDSTSTEYWQRRRRGRHIFAAAAAARTHTHTHT